jgi:hypothetical protein
MQHANDAIDEVRRAEFFRQGNAKRELIKGKKWLLMSRWRTALKRGELNRLFGLNRRIFKAYLLKESLEQLGNYSYAGAMTNYLKRWINQLKWQRLIPPVLLLGGIHQPAGRKHSMDSGGPHCGDQTGHSRHYNAVAVSIPDRRSVSAPPFRETRGHIAEAPDRHPELLRHEGPVRRSGGSRRQRMLTNLGRGYTNLRYLFLTAKRIAVANIEFMTFQTLQKAA